MNFDQILKERGLDDYFCEATRRVVVARILGQDVSELVQETRLAALIALDKAARKRVDAGETPDVAARAVATRNHIAAIASLAARETIRKYFERRRLTTLETEPVAARTATKTPNRPPLERLSPLHRQLYLAVADGLTTRQIANATAFPPRRVRDEIRKMKNAARRVAKETV